MINFKKKKKENINVGHQNMPPQIATVAQVLFELKIMRNSKCKKIKKKKKSSQSFLLFYQEGQNDSQSPETLINPKTERNLHNKTY